MTQNHIIYFLIIFTCTIAHFVCTCIILLSSTHLDQLKKYNLFRSTLSDPNGTIKEQIIYCRTDQDLFHHWTKVYNIRIHKQRKREISIVGQCRRRGENYPGGWFTNLTDGKYWRYISPSTCCKQYVLGRSPRPCLPQSNRLRPRQIKATVFRMRRYTDYIGWLYKLRGLRYASNHGKIGRCQRCPNRCIF